MTKMVVTVKGLNLRSEPDRNSANLATLPIFTVVNAVAKECDWVKIDSPREGWLFGQYVCNFTHEGLCIGFVLSEEGGMSQDRNDPGNWSGGAVGVGRLLGTKYGISGFAYPTLDIVNLTLSKAREIYHAEWFSPFASLKWPLSLYRMDAAVNLGKGGELFVFERWDKRSAAQYLEARRSYYRTLKNFPVYGDAWLGRVDRCGGFGRALRPE